METLNYPLSNVQIELMKLYGTNLSDDDINDLRDLLAGFFADRATAEANKIWDERGLTNEDMDKWLNEER